MPPRNRARLDYPSGYIGGDLSYADRERRYLLRLRELPATSIGARGQCRCGLTDYVRYHRGRWYCPRCGRRPAGGSYLVAELTRRRSLESADQLLAKR